MKIGIVTKGLFPFTVGGIERHSHCLASHLAALGAEVTVLTPEPEAAGAQGLPYQVRSLRCPPVRSYLVYTYLMAQAVDHALHGERFDVVYGQDMICSHYVRAPRELRAPLLWNPHGLELFHTVGCYAWLRAAPYRHHYRHLAAGAEACVSLGGKLDGIFLDELRVLPERLAVIPNAIDDGYIEQRLEPRTRRQPRELLFIGRLTRNKGAGLLIDAFNDLVGTDVGLTLVGKGPQERELRWRCRNPRVRFAGKVSDQELFSLLSRSGGLVLPSLYEGMPTVILEAMVAGVPVVATDIGAVSTMVRHGKTGLLVRPGSAQELRLGILALLGLDDERRVALETAARALVLERFTWPAVARATLELAKRVVAAGGRP